jgi:hypothetical protein
MAIAILTLAPSSAQDGAKRPNNAPALPKDAQDALGQTIDKIARSYVTIDPMIPTFTDWKTGNFLDYREQGALWIADESDKDTFLRLS